MREKYRIKRATIERPYQRLHYTRHYQRVNQVDAIKRD